MQSCKIMQTCSFHWKEMPTKRGSFETEADAARTSRTRQPKVRVTPSRRTVKPKPRVEPIPVKPVVKPKVDDEPKWNETWEKKSFYMVLHALTFQLLSCGPWSSSRSVIPQVWGIFRTLYISIRFLFASLVFYLEICSAMSMWGKASVQSNLVLKCWKKSVRSVRRHLTIELFGPFGPLWPDPLWFLCLGFCGSKAESWQPKAGLFAMSKDAESQTQISFLVIDEFHFHGHQGSDKSNLPNMKSWPLETPAAFGHTREGSTVKKSSFTHCRNFLTIWMWWSSIASPCIFKKSLSFPVMPWWCPHVTKSTRWQRDPPVCLRLNLSVFATQRFLVFLLFITVSAGCDLILLVADMVMLGAEQGFVN